MFPLQHFARPQLAQEKDRRSLLQLSIAHMLPPSYFPHTCQYRHFAENEFIGSLVSSSTWQPVELFLLWSWCFFFPVFALSLHVIFGVNVLLSRHHWTTAVRCPSQILDLSLVVNGISSSWQTKMESSPSLHLWVKSTKGVPTVFNNYLLLRSLHYVFFRGFSLYIDVCRMSQEQPTAVDWMTALRSGLLGPYQEMALWAAVVITAVHRTLTHPSSTNLKQVRLWVLLNIEA